MAKIDEEITGSQQDAGMPAGEAQMPTEGAMPATPTKKDSYMQGFKQRHPDWQDGDEEGFYGALSDDYAANEEEMSGYKSREDEMTQALSGSSLNAALFLEAQRGTAIPLALLQQYPDEIRAWMDDPQNEEAIKQAFEEHNQRLQEDAKLSEEASKNLEETNAVIDQMIADGEIADENEANELLKFLGEIAVGLMQNHVEKDWLIAAKNAKNYYNDVNAARTQGEIAGRNSKITAQRRDQQRGSQNHAGLGSPGAGQTLNRSEQKQATRGGNKGSMWDGMKTNKLN